jgi:hypothetical protein
MDFITKALLENKGVLIINCSVGGIDACITAVNFIRAGGKGAQLVDSCSVPPGGDMRKTAEDRRQGFNRLLKTLCSDVSPVISIRKTAVYEGTSVTFTVERV